MASQEDLIKYKDNLNLNMMNSIRMLVETDTEINLPSTSEEEKEKLKIKKNKIVEIMRLQRERFNELEKLITLSRQK